MVGITAYGAYIPRLRLDRKSMFQAVGWIEPANAPLARGEKAVAAYDEDSLTMAVAAGFDCRNALGEREIDYLVFTTTTPPYLERQSSAILTLALNLREDVQAVDMGGSVRAGTGGLLAAAAAVTSGRAKTALVCAADSRQAKAGSPQDYLFGDGAAALALGEDKVIARLLGSFSLACDFPDHRRTPPDPYNRSWEERWVRDEGYGRIIPRVIEGTLQKTQMKLEEFTTVITGCPNPRADEALSRGLGLKPEQRPENLLDKVGDCGSAYPLLLFISVLEKSRPKDKILLTGYGNGGDGLAFEVTPAIEKTTGSLGVEGHLKRREKLDSYTKYAVYRQKLEAETGIRGESAAPSSLSLLWRERQAILGLVGSLCSSCKTPQFPPQLICVNPSCRAAAQMEPYPFAKRRGTLFTYTADNLAYSVDPPAIYGIVDFQGGGRFWFDLTDCKVNDLAVGHPVTMSFRRKYYDHHRGIAGYFWKGVPQKKGGEGHG